MSGNPRACVLLGLCLALAANASAEEPRTAVAAELASQIEDHIAAKEHEAAGKLLGRFLSEHYHSTFRDRILLRAAALAARLGEPEEGVDLLIEARTWGTKLPPEFRIIAKGRPLGRGPSMRPSPNDYWEDGIPVRKNALPFSTSKRPPDLQLCLVAKAALTSIEKGKWSTRSADKPRKCAIRAYEELLRKHRRSRYAIHALRDLPAIYARTGMLKEALAALGKLRERDPEHEVATTEGMAFHRALLEAEHWFRKQADDTNMPIAKVTAPLDQLVMADVSDEYAARATYEKGRLLDRLGRAGKAGLAYEQVLKRWPRTEVAPEALARIGQKHYKRGLNLGKIKGPFGPDPDAERAAADARAREEYRKAAAPFAKVFREHPEHKLAAKSGVLAGNNWLRARDYDKAIEIYRAVIAKADDYDYHVVAEGMYWLGDCLVRTKDIAAARKVWRRLSGDYPETKWAKYARARLAEKGE